MSNYNWFSPRNPTLHKAMRTVVPLREPNEIIRVHHVTYHNDKLQLEIERDSKVLGIAFERLIL